LTLTAEALRNMSTQNEPRFPAFDRFKADGFWCLNYCEMTNIPEKIERSQNSKYFWHAGAVLCL
jgi:hypothetical protein